MLYVALDITSNVVAYKMIAIWFLVLPASAFIFPVTYIVADIITEVYTFNVTKMVIWCSVIMGFISTSLIMLVIYLPSPDFWDNSKEFNTVLGSTWRIVVGGYIGNIFGSFINVILISKFRVVFKNKYFAFRAITSSAIGTIIYVLVAGTIILYGLTSLNNAVDIMVSNYMVKMLFISIFAYPSSLLCNYLKKKENIDDNVYSLDENFNPFKIRREYEIN